MLPATARHRMPQPAHASRRMQIAELPSAGLSWTALASGVCHRSWPLLALRAARCLSPEWLDALPPGSPHLWRPCRYGKLAMVCVGLQPCNGQLTLTYGITPLVATPRFQVCRAGVPAAVLEPAILRSSLLPPRLGVHQAGVVSLLPS